MALIGAGWGRPVRLLHATARCVQHPAPDKFRARLDWMEAASFTSSKSRDFILALAKA